MIISVVEQRRSKRMPTRMAEMFTARGRVYRVEGRSGGVRCSPSALYALVGHHMSLCRFGARASSDTGSLARKRRWVGSIDGVEVCAVHARLTLHTADPARLGEVISHHEEDVMEVFTHEPGYRGMSVLVNDDQGVALVEAYWATEKEMRSNDATFVRPVHDAAFFGATVSIEHYKVARFVHAAPARPGAAVSLTRLETEPTSPDDVLAAYGGIDLGPLADSDGFITAVLFVDGQSGRAVIETIWRDGQALVAARSVAAARRLEAVSAGTVRVRGLEQYRLDFHSVELE